MAIVSIAVPEGEPTYWSAVDDEITNYVDYLNTNTSGTTFSKYDYGNVPFWGDDYCISYSCNGQFIEDVLNHLDKERSLIENENVVIPHGVAAWGYGRSKQVTTDLGTNAYGCTVYADGLVGKREIRGFVWHEASHNYGAWHDDATYKVNGYDEMYDITPMTMSYLHAENGEVDTTWEGGSDDPYEYCWGRDNYAWPYFEDRPERHDISRLSDCALNKIQNWIDTNY